jgi:signal transduction histidine kinase
MNDNGALRESRRDGLQWPGRDRPDEAAAGLGRLGPGQRRRRRGLAAPLALPAGFGALLVVGAIAAATHGGLSAGWVLGLAAAIVLVAAAVSEPSVAPVLAAVGWLTVIGFSRAPYAQLQPGGMHGLVAAAVIVGCTLAGLGGGLVLRRVAGGFTLWIVDVAGEPQPGQDNTPDLPGLAGLPESARPGSARPGSAPSGSAPSDAPRPEPARAGRPVPPGRAARRRARARGWRGDLTGGIGRRRLLSGVLLVGGLPLLTWLLSLGSAHPLGDVLLVYLVAVVAIAVVGGFWPAVLAAITASLLVNWYFTPPLHTLTIGDGESLVALLLFITVAVTVSSVVHLAAHRARQAARSTGEAQELLALAQTVLGGADSPVAVLAHLTTGHGGRAELLERAGGRWVKVAASAGRPAGPEATDSQPAAGPEPRALAGPELRVPAGPELRALARPDLVLVATGQTTLLTERLLHGYAAQAAAALDRDRLRTQAAQAEALAEGNRMRTALLAAVSHDLRTPLASIKASVSTLRQTDVTWTPDDEAELLATIERSSDRLDALIGNLLDMSRLTAGSLQPFLRPTAIDEVAPVALRGLDAGTRMQLQVPDDLPLVRTDPGLLERVLANLFANALAYSPPGRDPELRARPSGGSVLLEIVDHGRGVPDELKTKMFEPFLRLDGRSGPGAARGGQPDPAIELATAGGVGLGLAVVRGFLDIMGGSVEAADTPHGGLTMRVRLPAATDASPGDAGPGEAGAAASGPAAGGRSPLSWPDPVSPELREPGER